MAQQAALLVGEGEGALGAAAHAIGAVAVAALGLGQLHY